jgi:cytoskeletal protein CcmA (bactofilin family)
MFSKSRPGRPDVSSEVGSPPPGRAPVPSERALPAEEPTPRAELSASPEPSRFTQTNSKVSFLAADLTLVGTLKTSGDVVIEGVVEGDIQAFKVTLGEQSTLRGEVVADDLTVRGRVEGQLTGLKVYLTSTARVGGDITHQVLAIDAGAQFDGSAQRMTTEPAPQAAAPTAGQPRSSAPPPAPPGKPADATRTKSSSAP